MRWPHAEICSDVREINEEKIWQWLRQYVGIKEIHLWAGFPCTDLSSAKYGRRELEGERSGLFFEIPRILRLLKKEVPNFVQVKFVAENVASMSKKACSEISSELNVWPVRLNCADAVPMNRPRLCWTSESLDRAVDGLEISEEEFWYDIKAQGPYPEPSQWMEPGVYWEGALTGEVLPTAMRAIIRHQPPPAPAGLSRCDSNALARWAAEHYKFPPYHYLSRFVFWERSEVAFV